MFRSSGNLLADRRYELARAYAADGDVAAAADLFAQAAEIAPHFASAWFALGEARKRLGDREAAIAAFRQALAADPADHHGAGLHLARLGAADAATAMSPGYVRALFDQYAPRFDDALASLSYSAPDLLREAVYGLSQAQYFGKMAHFENMLDLGCGTGLVGVAFRPYVDRLTGVDLSPKMVDEARRKGIYDTLAVADMEVFLGAQDAGAFDLVVAADVFVYLADLVPVLTAVARVLARNGLLVFTTEGRQDWVKSVVLGEKLRYAHSSAYIEEAIERAGLWKCQMTSASTRTENGVAVPGLLFGARRMTIPPPGTT